MHFCPAYSIAMSGSKHTMLQFMPTFYECSCGPARHAALLQLRTHCTARAIDNVPQMLEYAEKVAAEAGASVHFTCEDMRHFSLQV